MSISANRGLRVGVTMFALALSVWLAAIRCQSKDAQSFLKSLQSNNNNNNNIVIYKIIIIRDYIWDNIIYEIIAIWVTIKSYC